MANTHSLARNRLSRCDRSRFHRSSFHLRKMKTSTFLIAATLIASLQTIPVWAKGGGEGNNTDCNGVGNPNSPCAPSGGAGGSSSIGDVKNTNDNSNANTNTNSNNNLNTSTGIGVGVGIGTGGAGGEGGRGGRGGDAASDASANAAGGSATGGNAQGGNAQGGQGGSAKSYSALSNDIDSSTRSISFAAPAWTVIPTAAGCVVSSSRAWSALFGMASYSGSQQASDAVCVMVGMAAAAQNACQYKAAAIVNRRVFEALNPGVSGEFFEQLAQADLSPVDCALLVKYAR